MNLFEAAATGDVQAVKARLAAGDAVDLRDSEMDPNLKSHFKVGFAMFGIKVLEDAPPPEDAMGRTALMHAAAGGHVDVLDVLNSGVEWVDIVNFKR